MALPFSSQYAKIIIVKRIKKAAKFWLIEAILLLKNPKFQALNPKQY